MKFETCFANKEFPLGLRVEVHGTIFAVHKHGSGLSIVSRPVLGAERGTLCHSCEVISGPSGVPNLLACDHCLNKELVSGRVSTLGPADVGCERPKVVNQIERLITETSDRAVAAHFDAFWGERPNVSAFDPATNTYVGIDRELQAAAEATGRDPIQRMVHDDNVSPAELCTASFSMLDAIGIGGAADCSLVDPTLDPDGAVEIFDVDKGCMVTVNNNRRIAGGFADQVQRELKGAIK